MNTTLWRNATLASFNPEYGSGYGLLPAHDVLVEHGRITAIAPTGTLTADQVVEVGGALITPSLVDCHTHLVFGGSRAHEWERRQNGVSYQQISAEGGGINSTVRATRETGEDELYRLSEQRLHSLLVEGVGLVEIKSGYGLNLEAEAKMLRVAARLQQSGAVEVSRTLLAAHAVPP